jgi:hypothetical protein
LDFKAFYDKSYDEFDLSGKIVFIDEVDLSGVIYLG